MADFIVVSSLFFCCFFLMNSIFVLKTDAIHLVIFVKTKGKGPGILIVRESIPSSRGYTRV